MPCASTSRRPATQGAVLRASNEGRRRGRRRADRAPNHGAELDRRVRHELLAPEPAELAGWGAVLRERTPCTPSDTAWAGVVGIEDEHPPPHPSEHEGRVIQPRGARAHDEHVEPVA